jgi:penicillin-binding protein 2
MIRFNIIIFLFIFIWGVLVLKVYFISILSNSHYEELAQENSTNSEYINPTRSSIIDRNGFFLATNKFGFELYISSKLFYSSNKKLLDKKLKSLSDIFDLDQKLAKKIQLIKKQKTYYQENYSKIIDFIEYKKIMKYYSLINLDEFLYLKPILIRHYPYDDVASHTIGYTGKTTKIEIQEQKFEDFIPEKIGKTGIEKQYEDYLRGIEGFKKYRVSALNQKLNEIEYNEPVNNANLQLTIDINLQKFISNLFKKENNTGSVVIMTTLGEVLSIGSYPEYDLNVFAKGISYKDWQNLSKNINKPFTHKAVNGLYPPASIVKLLTGISFIEYSDSFKYKKYNCTGKVKVSQRNFRCWKKHGHGSTNLKKAIRESCDDFFYKGSLEVGINNISKTFFRYGLGKKTGIDLPNEFIGTVPNREWKASKYGKSWYIGETLNTSIGQGNLLVTPMQIAKVTSFIASGVEVEPFLIKYSKPKINDFLSDKEKNNLKLIRKGMREVVSNWRGTAYKYAKPLSNITKLAGKTGTAQVVGIPQKKKNRLKESELEYLKRSHAWFSGFFPYDNPTFVITVLVEHGGYGGTKAVPIATKIIKKMKELNYF